MLGNVFFERKCDYVFKSFKKGKRHASQDNCKYASEVNLHQRTGDNGIRNSRGRARRHCNTRHCDFQAETSGALDCHIRRNAETLRQFAYSYGCGGSFKLAELKGQSSVEFAVVAIVLVAVVVGVGAILSGLTDGTFLMHAIMAATNNISTSVSGAIDAFSF